MKMEKELDSVITSYINGEFISYKHSHEIKSPETQEIVAKYGNLSITELKKSFDYANDAFKEWKNFTPNERIKYIKLFNDELKANVDYFSKLIVESIAKPFNSAKDEVIRSIEMVDELIKTYEQKFIKPIIIGEETHHIKGKKGIWKYEPIGVVVAISPFNYPLNLLISKIIPALLAGNTVLYKSATQTASIGYAVIKIFDNIKIPKGVINFIVGKGEEVGDELISNKHIKIINFTGGTETGKKITEKSPYNAYKILEMGGLDPALVTKNNHDLKSVAKEIIKGALSFSGQRCTAIKRLILLRDNKKQNEDLKKYLIEEINNLSVGKAINNAMITSLISKKSLDKVIGLYNNAIENGATALTNYKVENNIFHPVLLDNVTDKMRLYNTEAFGPILPIIYANSIDDMIRIANDTEYGLQASVFTEDEKEWLNISKQIDSGSVNWNRSSSRGPDYFPFLGVKNSGFNVQGITESLRTVLRLKGYIENK